MKRLEKFENHRLILLLIDFFYRLYSNLLFFKIEKEIEPAFSFPLFNFQLPREKLKTMLVHSFGGQISCIVGLCGSGDLLHCTFNKANLQIKPSYTVGHAPIFS